MQELTRRQAICRITAIMAGGAAAQAGFGGCRKSNPASHAQDAFAGNPDHASQKRRMGTFEETAKNFILWLNMRGYKADEAGIKAFADGQPFEPDAKLIEFALDTASGRLKEYSIVKDDYILEWMPARIPFSARIIKAGKAGRYEIFSVVDIFGTRIDGVGGVSANMVSDKKRILIFEKAIESEAMISRERIASMLRRALPQHLHTPSIQR